jgi:hypothetical protein
MLARNAPVKLVILLEPSQTLPVISRIEIFRPLTLPRFAFRISQPWTPTLWLSLHHQNKGAQH